MPGTMGKTMTLATIVVGAALVAGCAPREAVPMTTTGAAATSADAPPRPGEIQRGLGAALVKFEGTAQVDCAVRDASGKTLLEGTSFFDENSRGGIEIEHRDAAGARRLRVSRMPDAAGGGMVLELQYEEQRKADDAKIEFRPVMRVAQKGSSEVSVKLPDGQERRFTLAAR